MSLSVKKNAVSLSQKNRKFCVVFVFQSYIKKIHEYDIVSTLCRVYRWVYENKKNAVSLFLKKNRNFVLFFVF